MGGHFVTYIFSLIKLSVRSKQFMYIPVYTYLKLFFFKYCYNSFIVFTELLVFRYSSESHQSDIVKLVIPSCSYTFVYINSFYSTKRNVFIIYVYINIV